MQARWLADTAVRIAPKPGNNVYARAAQFAGIVLIVAMTSAAADIPVRKYCQEADLIVVGRIIAADAASGTSARSGEATLAFAHAEIAVEQVLKGNDQLTAVSLRWIREARTGKTRTVGLWGRGVAQTQSFALGDHGLWFLHRVQLAPLVYACPGGDRFLPANDGAYRGTLETVRIALAVEVNPNAPIQDGLQLTVETTQRSYPADGPVQINVVMRNVGRLEAGADAIDPKRKRAVYKFDAELLTVHGTVEIRRNGTKKLRRPPWRPGDDGEPRQLVQLATGDGQSGVYDVSTRLPAEAGVYKLRLICQPPGCPRLLSNWIWICRDVEPTAGLVLVASTYWPHSAAARIPMLKVSLVNVTEEPKVVPLLDHRLFTEWCKGGIVDARDRNVTWRPQFEEPPVTVHNRLRLAPGAMRTITVPIARLAEFKKPGRYAIRLACRLPGVGLLFANRVPFEVKPPRGGKLIVNSR